MKKLITILLAGLFITTVSAQQSASFRNNEEKLNAAYCTGLFRTTDGTIFDMVSQPGIGAYFNILEWLNGRIAGLQVYTSRTGVVIPVIRGRIPNIFIDEQQVSASLLSSLSVHDIAMVKVIKQPFVGGFNSDGGAIAIYTIAEEETEESTGGR
jgi:hypothetical protein